MDHLKQIDSLINEAEKKLLDSSSEVDKKSIIEDLKDLYQEKFNILNQSPFHYSLFDTYGTDRKKRKRFN
jgi:hypothetical protein